LSATCISKVAQAALKRSSMENKEYLNNFINVKLAILNWNF
jgi:hypothetical protein